MRACALLCLAAASFVAASSLRAENGDDAVSALAQLTNPTRLAQLTDAAFAAQLGPALGWLHVARRRDISPEAIITRAFRANGLDGDRARLTRDALLRNLARADGWELFAFAESAQALALGRPALIQTGVHRGHLAGAELMPTGAPREFADLVLRSDDEPALRPPVRPLPRPPRLDERLAGRAPGRRRVHRPDPVAPIPTVYDDALPVR